MDNSHILKLLESNLFLRRNFLRWRAVEAFDGWSIYYSLTLAKVLQHVTKTFCNCRTSGFYRKNFLFNYMFKFISKLYMNTNKIMKTQVFQERKYDLKDSYGQLLSFFFLISVGLTIKMKLVRSLKYFPIQHDKKLNIILPPCSRMKVFILLKIRSFSLCQL